jgi:DNA repair protein RadC
MLGPRLAAREQEELHALGLDNQSRLVTHSVAARGTRDLVPVHARDIFRQVVRENCCSVIVVHNHPSGDVEPSETDLELTVHLRRAGEVMQLPLTDHVIVGRRGHFSFKSAGMLERQEFGH